MYRRYRPNRRNNSHALPLTAIGLVLAALATWGIWVKGGDVIRFFKGETRIVHDNTEANDNLNRLMNDLAGDKSKLLELAENSKTRLGWITDDNTRRQFRWFLMCRLLDKGQWEEVVRILPEVETLAPVEGLDRLAVAALEHKDYDLQLRLDKQLQDKVVDMPSQTAMLLRSIRRTAQTCVHMHRSDAAVQAISRLDIPSVLARLTDPTLASEAAALQMMRASVCEVKDPVLQKVRNILEQAKWPLCPATSQLMLEEVSTTLRDNPNLSQNALKEIETKLLRCRDSMLEYPDREHRLPQCYMMLGELRFRMNDFAGCSQALTLAGAFADGYGEMTSDLQLRLCRVRSRAMEACGAMAEAADDCRYLLEHDSDTKEQFRALGFLAKQASGADKTKLLTQAWDMLEKEPKLAKDSSADKSAIASQLAEYYREKEDYANAVKWVSASVKLVEASNPDLTDGKLLHARVQLALMHRKAKADVQALRTLRDVVRAIERMSEEDRAKLDAAAPQLYRTAVREFSRTYYVSGDKSLAKDVIKKIRESLPERVR